MGINRGSLYDTFKDKRSLFLAAIAHYDDIIVGRAIARLEAPGAAKQAIVEHCFDLVERAAADTQRRGCLLVNSAV
jgi:TetR/AcrR family transcriptional repressor of nem operon